MTRPGKLSGGFLFKCGLPAAAIAIWLKKNKVGGIQLPEDRGCLPARFRRVTFMIDFFDPLIFYLNYLLKPLIPNPGLLILDYGSSFSYHFLCLD